MEYMKEFEKLPPKLNKWANTAVSKIEARPVRQASAREIKKEISELTKKYKKLDEKEQIQAILKDLGDPNERAEQLRKEEIYNPKTQLKYYMFAGLLIVLGSFVTAYPLLILLSSSDFITLNIKAFSIFEDTKQVISALTSGIVMLVLGIGAARVAKSYSKNRPPKE